MPIWEINFCSRVLQLSMLPWCRKGSRLPYVAKNDLERLRRRNTRYKNPQLGAQHCFVASFGHCFALFTLHDQLDPQQKHLLQVEEMERSDWLICQSASKFVARCELWAWWKTSSKAKICRSNFCNNFLQPPTNATSWSRKVKNGKHRPKLGTKQCCAPSWGFLYLVFRRL